MKKKPQQAVELTVQRLKRCCLCKLKNPLMVMLNDDVWLEIVESQGKPVVGEKAVLCFNCIEKRLGRALTFDDLMETGITYQMMLGAYIASREKRKFSLVDLPRSYGGGDSYRTQMIKSLLGAT